MRGPPTIQYRRKPLFSAVRVSGAFPGNDLPPVSSDLAKTGIRYRGAVIWNIVLNDHTNVNVSEAVFKKSPRKTTINQVIPSLIFF